MNEIKKVTSRMMCVMARRDGFFKETEVSVNLPGSVVSCYFYFSSEYNQPTNKDIEGP